MAKEFIFHSNVSEGGELQKNIRQLIKDCLPSFKKKRVEIIIRKLSSKRSEQQNKYYWACVVNEQIDCFKERWGEVYSQSQVHEWNKANIFCTEKVDEATGEIFKMPDSSTKETKSSWEEKMEMCRQFFWLKFEWKIPLPNENKKLEL